MSQSAERLKKALLEAVSTTMENMAFEQVELIDNENNLQEEISGEAPADEFGGVDEGATDEQAENQSESSDKAVEDLEQTSVNQVIQNLWTSIAIIKPIHGTMILEFKCGYAQKLTEAIYGEIGDDNLSASTVLDAVAELINTISGRFIDELISADKEFELGLPNTGEGDTPEIENEVISLLFDLGGYTMRAVVSGNDILNLVSEKKKIKENVS